MSKVKNPTRRCRICGGKCEKVMRYCKLCAKERKAAKEGEEKSEKNLRHPIVNANGIWYNIGVDRG